MTTWRVIGTDSESDDGVAPVCPQPVLHLAMRGRPPSPNDFDVYAECCIGPHLRVPASTSYANTTMAIRLAEALTALGLEDLEICE